MLQSFDNFWQEIAFHFCQSYFQKTSASRSWQQKLCSRSLWCFSCGTPMWRCFLRRRRAYVWLFARGRVCLFSRLALLFTSARFYKLASNYCGRLSHLPIPLCWCLHLLVITFAEIGQGSLTIEEVSVEFLWNFTILEVHTRILLRSLCCCFVHSENVCSLSAWGTIRNACILVLVLMQFNRCMD